MKKVLLLTLGVVLSACSTGKQTVSVPPIVTENSEGAGDVKKVAAKRAPSPPIEVKASPEVLATIDPVTLKVTYKKGASVKAFADEVVKAWAQSQNQLNQCYGQLRAASAKRD